jgi:HEAT repeat protein
VQSKSDSESRNIEIEEKRQKLLSSKGISDRLPFVLESFTDDSWRIRKTALDVLIEGYSPHVFLRDLIDLLYLEDNAGARNTAIEALIQLGKKGLPDLIEAFDTDNHDVRKFIIDVIGVISCKESLPLLLKAVKDEDVNVRASAVEYLGKMKESSVIDALIDIIEEGDIWTAYPAVDALGRIGDKRSIPYLLKSLKKRELTEPALRALSEFSEPDTLKNVIPLLRDHRRSIQEETLRTIEKYYQNGVSEDFISDQLRKVLGDEAFDICLKHIESSNRDVKVSAIIILGLLRDHRAIDYLLELSDDESLRDIVKRSLVFIGRKHPDYLIPPVHTEVTEKRRVIVYVISELRNPFFNELLLSLIKDIDGHVVVNAPILMFSRRRLRL